MILLDEIDTLEKDPNAFLKRNKSRAESLPPYSKAGPQSESHKSVVSFSSLSTSSSSTASSSSPASHPRSASLSTLTINHPSAFASTSTLVPPRSPSPSLTSPLAHSFRRTPPQHLRASNNVYIERETAGITDPFVIDPLLEVPDCLLPDGIPRGEQRCNLSLVSKAGDICADVWVREGCAFMSHKPPWHWDEMEADGDEDDYWADDWIYRPPLQPCEQESQLPTFIEARTGRGSISLRIHAQFHQRLRIRVSSMDKPVAVAIPRSFTGYIYINHDPEFSTECPFSDMPTRLLPTALRSSVHFSPEVQEVVKTEVEQRRMGKGRYFIGLATDQIEPKEHLDSLSIDCRNGTISIFFVTNPSFGLTKPDNTLFGKLMTKARS